MNRTTNAEMYIPCDTREVNLHMPLSAAEWIEHSFMKDKFIN